MPVLTGIEAKAARLGTKAQKQSKTKQVRSKPEKAETGRKETAKEFASRMKKKIQIIGPCPIVKPKAQNTLLLNTDTVESSEEEEGGDIHNTHPESKPINLTEQTLNGFDVKTAIQKRYHEDNWFKCALDSPKEYKNLTERDGLVYLRNGHNKVLCIPDIKSEGRSVRERVIDGAHIILAHLSARKTLAYLKKFVWWKSMAHDVDAFCRSCSNCQKNKTRNQAPYGLLNTLEVPSMPWETIGVDFVGPLPISRNRDAEFDAITVVIDHLSAMVHLAPSRTDYNARNVAELLFYEVYRHHRIPKAIVSDRDSLFTSDFWRHLHKLIGSNLCMSSAYHPESDGATERANRTIVQMIRQCIGTNQKDWVVKLPAIEFAINSA